ncbi:probable methyltransferase PMT25 [Juglans microcarpa x Juglans regia]|uniref:probable methyltransferase PMT25 n=1 Tax=Juglans microcarpa x Juglans regia TaxID=2249226 RepID=UPI001B7F4D36|nr:probable methyltransferase PMT25 [Juglans microcarpa x Juglans regia]
MAQVKYSRVDGRKSSSYRSTISIVVFVAFCLVGIWTLMSSIVPTQNSDLTSEEAVNQVVTENGSRQFDSSGGLPEDSTKEDSNTRNDQNIIERESGNVAEENQEKVATKESSDSEQTGLEERQGNNESDLVEGENKINTDESQDGPKQVDEVLGETVEKDATENNKEIQEKNQGSDELLPAGAQSEILNETNTQNGAWSTQAIESENEKESQQSSITKDDSDCRWKLCNVTAGPDYIPCLDNWQAIRKLPSMSHFEHRERHCPDEAPTCLVPLPKGYRQPIKWPESRGKIWYYNVPHTKLAVVKGHQNWVKITGEYLTFPGGGTQFINGALHYIDFIQKSLPAIAWGKRSRVILDVGCGVASFGGFLFERDVLAMSFAPKDEHEAQVQFALERGIPAISSVMGTKRLTFPSGVFDVVHCARCRVPWHIEGGKLLLELNRVLRPGGYFVWSATPVYRKNPEDSGIWKAMSELTKSMCWDLVVIGEDKLDGVKAAIYRKPTSNECYEKRPQNVPPICKESDDPNAAWNVPMQACMHKVPISASERGSRWPEQWPRRLEKAPYWLNSQVGVYRKGALEDFTADYKHWKNVVSKSYLNGMGINWSSVRNVMDMRAVYGGFAAALKDLKVWVMNVVPIDSPDTLPIIYERGLFGIYHDWCESFNTYPRSYDLLHADYLFSTLKRRCNLAAVFAEVDRILRPEGKLIIRDDGETVEEVEKMAKSLKWEIRLIYSEDNKGLLCVQKTLWRPTEMETIKSAIA